MPQDASFWKEFTARRFLSQVAWDSFSQNVIANQAGKYPLSHLNREGYFTSPLNDNEAKDLSDLFRACSPSTFNGDERDPAYFYEPRRQVHEYFNRTNNYFRPSPEMNQRLQIFLTQILRHVGFELGPKRIS